MNTRTGRTVYYKNYIIEEHIPDDTITMFTGYYRDGNVKCKYSYKNDTKIIEGLYREWEVDGKRWQCEYKDGKRNGKFEKWYETGKKYMEANYKEGKVEGNVIKWDRKGNEIN